MRPEAARRTRSAHSRSTTALGLPSSNDVTGPEKAADHQGRASAAGDAGHVGSLRRRAAMRSHYESQGDLLQRARWCFPRSTASSRASLKSLGKLTRLVPLVQAVVLRRSAMSSATAWSVERRCRATRHPSIPSVRSRGPQKRQQHPDTRIHCRTTKDGIWATKDST